MADGDDRDDAPLLLHSLAEFRELIFAALELADARRVVEVGGEAGLFTRELLSWGEKRGAAVYCVEPQPTPELTEALDSSPVGHLVTAPSPEGLEGIEADAYLMDGDHNYHTVTAELEAIERHARERPVPPLVFVHDIGWPSGRRDMYYAPDRLPEGAVHPYTYEQGVTLGPTHTVDGGFRGEHRHAWAREEGGPANGVLTAVEDFLERRTGLRLVKVPSVFGLGILYAEAAPYADSLATELSAYDGNPMLERLERNRLRLYLRLLELQDEALELHGLLDECRRQAAHLQAQSEAMRSRLEAQRDALRFELELLLKSRAFAVAERLSALQSRLDGKPPVGQRLRAALESTSEEEDGR